jgi:ribosomal protein S18 acetylase RimI-like enzyme
VTTLRPFTQTEFTAWLEHAVPEYAAGKVKAGAWPADAALEMSRQEHAKLLPQGTSTPGQHLYAIVDSAGQRVGTLWFARRAKGALQVAYVFNVEVDPAHQRQGHAERAFAALNDEVRKLGLASIELQVFGHNTAARALYNKLGFAPINLVLGKAVDAALGLTVRQAGAADLGSLAMLFDGYRQFQGQAPDVPAALAFLRQRFERSESVLFIAQHGDVPVGFAQLYPSFSSVALRRVFILNDLFVAPAGRRQNVATQLLAAVEAHAADQGAVRVSLNVARLNTAAQALYKARGWQQDEVFFMFHHHTPP